MLHTIPGEDFNPPIVKDDGDVYGNLARRRPQHLPHPIIQAEPIGRLIKARLGGQKRIEFW